MIESHMVRRPSSRKHDTPKLTPHHTLPLSHEEGRCLYAWWSLRCSNVLNAEQGEPGNGLDFDWMKINFYIERFSSFVDQQLCVTRYEGRFTSIIIIFT